MQRANWGSRRGAPSPDGPKTLAGASPAAVVHPDWLVMVSFLLPVIGGDILMCLVLTNEMGKSVYAGDVIPERLSHRLSPRQQPFLSPGSSPLLPVTTCAWRCPSHSTELKRKTGPFDDIKPLKLPALKPLFMTSWRKVHTPYCLHQLICSPKDPNYIPWLVTYLLGIKPTVPEEGSELSCASRKTS